MPIILLCLLIAIYFDVALFKRRDLELFKQVFRFSRAQVLLGLLLVAAVLLLSQDLWGDVPAVLLLLILPVYLLRRSRFVKTIGNIDVGATLPGGSPLGEAEGRQAAGPPLPLLSGALGVIIIWTYGIITFGLFLSAVMDLAQGAVSEMGELLLSSVFSLFLVLSLVHQASRHFPGKDFRAKMGLRKGRRPWIKVVLLPVVLGVLFALASTYLGLSRHVQPRTPLNDVLETTQSFSLIFVFLFLAVAIAPLIEEVVFRGYFFYVIKQWLGTRKTVVIIALIFAYLHVGQYWGDWAAILMVAVLGFMLTLLRAWTGTTLASVIAHYVYNGSVTILPIVIIAISNPAYFQYTTYYPYHDAPTKESLLKKSIAAQPDLSDAYNDLAWLYAEENMKLEEALRLVNKALEYAPEYPPYLDTKAQVLKKLGRMEEAKPIRDYLKEKYNLTPR